MSFVVRRYDFTISTEMRELLRGAETEQGHQHCFWPTHSPHQFDPAQQAKQI